MDFGAVSVEREVGGRRYPFWSLRVWGSGTARSPVPLGPPFSPPPRGPSPGGREGRDGAPIAPSGRGRVGQGVTLPASARPLASKRNDLAAGYCNCPGSHFSNIAIDHPPTRARGSVLRDLRAIVRIFDPTAAQRFIQMYRSQPVGQHRLHQLVLGLE